VATYLTTIAALFVLMVGWVIVQQSAKLFAKKHPEFGPYREKVGCGGGCKSKECTEEMCDTAQPR
jgi:hypothetical protein